MFIDTAKVWIEAGAGGDGAVSFRHEIYIPKGGPDGGNGGRGGDVVFLASRDENTLLDFRYNPELKAGNGGRGGKRQAAGKSGKDLVVKVPVGTVVRRGDEVVADLTEDGERVVVAHGGDGGFGNAHFKSSVRQAPRVAEKGEPGEKFEAQLELKLLADVGLVGFPNAGKSTFLSVVSNAKPEIADYEFTTLTPNLGVATVDDTDILIADIPGLIEGASEGKGLGIAFLRHVERTAVLLHLIDVYADDVAEKYLKIRAELEKYNVDLAERPEVVALTKTEGFDKELLDLQRESLKAVTGSPIFAISAKAHLGLTEVLRALHGEIEAFRAVEVEVEPDKAEMEVIELPKEAYKVAFAVEKSGDKFVVTGAKIEKFAVKTDFDNYDSVNRLRDILKKMGIRAELARLGAGADSTIVIAGKEFRLVEK
ncbi:MAG: GTPase ObgE [Candidatus Nomurabacteria bacterium]|jgi:GTP-binding protein|nr:GTPase ObgE [Candidatus Nomurabacteria bacterium]